MKKKFFNIFFTLLFCLPFMFLFSACKSKNNIKVDVDSKEYISILKENGKFSKSESVGSDLKYNIFLSDSYDHEKLKIYNNGSEISWTVDEEFSNRVSYLVVSDHKSKVGYFEIKNAQKDVNLSFECSEREIKITFSNQSNSKIDSEKQAMLNDFNLSQTDTLFDALTTGYTLTTTFSKLKTDDGTKLLLTSNKPIGYYSTQTNENNLFIVDLQPEKQISKYTYSITIPSLLSNNKIFINTDNLSFNTFSFTKENLEIIDIFSNDGLDPTGFVSNSVGKFIIQVDGLNQANLDNAKLFIGTTQIAFDKQTGEYELDIENKCPIDFGCESFSEFNFSLTGVVFEATDEICKLEYNLETGESVKSAYYANANILYYDLNSKINLTLKFNKQSSIILKFNFQKATEEPFDHEIDISNYISNPFMSDVIYLNDDTRGINLTIHVNDENADEQTTIDEITQIDIEITSVNGTIIVSK